MKAALYTLTLATITAAAVSAAPTYAAARGSTLLDVRTRALVSQASDCVKRADKVWREEAHPTQITDAKLFDLDVQVWVARCTLDFGVLAKRDRRGDWTTFESPARRAIGAVQGWSESGFNFLQALRKKSKPFYNKAVNQTTGAVMLWRSAVREINADRVAAGLRPL